MGYMDLLAVFVMGILQVFFINLILIKPLQKRIDDLQELVFQNFLGLDKNDE